MSIVRDFLGFGSIATRGRFLGTQEGSLMIEV